MKKETSTIIIISIIVIVLIILFNNVYENKMGEKKVICDFIINYENYDEKVTFSFKNNKIVKYDREEKFYDTEEHPINDIYEEFKETEEKYKDSNTFIYTVNLKNKIVYINTSIDVLKEEEFFKNYIGGMGIEYNYTPQQVVDKLNTTNYKCVIK